MSETLLNYINRDVKLSKKIKNIEKDFKNGYLFAELLSKEGFLITNKLSFFNASAKTKAEIKLNYILLREDLSKLGIHLDDSSIESLTNNTKGSTTNLLYKIKTQIDRQKIKFDDIMTKILGYQKEEKDKLTKKNFDKTYYKTKSDFSSNTNKLPQLTYMSTFYGTKTNFNSVKRKQAKNLGLNINTFENNNKFQENNKYASDIILEETKYGKNKLEPLTTNSNLMPLIQRASKNEAKFEKDLLFLKENLKSKNTQKNDEIEEEPDSELNKDSKLYQQQQKKFKSHGKNQHKMKVFSEKFLEYNNKYIKYSCFDRNTFKIGIDLKEIDPKLYKQGIGYKNDYIPNEIVLHRLKKKVNEREEEFKKKIEEKKFMTEEERYLKNSIISQNLKNNGKKFQINFSKNTQLYKMHEYEDYRKEAFPFKKKINSKLLYIKSENDNNINDRGYAKTMDRFYTKTIMSNFSGEFKNLKNNQEFYNEYLEKESLTQRKKNCENKRILREKNYSKIENIVNLIIDLTDELFYYQHKKKIELIEIPAFKNLIADFIKGKINLTCSNQNTNSLINLEDQNLRKNEEDEEKDNLNNEKYLSGYNDYIFLRGEWCENKYIPKSFYGSQLHVYQVLGEDINNLIASGKMVTQGVKPSMLMKMKNEEFELKESEKDNINLPKENAKNRLFGEIIELNFDNMPTNFAMNSINNNLGITNLKNNENKSKLINKKIVFQEITNNNANDDTLYTNNKDLIKINNSIVNSSNPKFQSNTSNNIINNDLNISEIGQDPNKSFHNIDETMLNNNTANNNNNTNIQNNNQNSPNLNQNNDNDFSHIPIKMCLIGHSFSGRKTQAKLLCSKYPKLKYYSLEKMIKDYFSEYERLHTPLENNPKQKNIKKNQLEKLENQRIEELKQYEYIFKILEPFIKDNKQAQELTDEAKINLFIQQIKKDFPRREGDIYEIIAKRNLRKQTIEQELERLKEEAEKKKKLGPKEIKEQQSLEKELDDLIKEGFYGFILVDFPNNYNQYIKFENILTGFVQQIDKEENIRDKYLELLTFSIDKPYANISHLCPEVMKYLGYGKNTLYKSFFNNYIWLEIDEEETLKRVNDRLIDETTNIIYHKEFDPPPQEKKLLERLKPVTEPSEETIKNELKNYDIEFPKILSYISLFHNLKKITKIKKNEVLEEIDEILLNTVKKFEDREIKDEINELNNFDPDESENIKYFKKLNEVKKRVNRELSGNIIFLWSECLNNYSKGVKQFLLNFSSLKKNILDKMDIMQEIFIQYLNNPSQKKKLVELFQKKYEAFIDKYNYLKKKKIVREEFQKDVVELTEHFWEIIQMRKRDAINELKNLKDQHFIENQSEIFWDYLCKLFLVETNFYIKKLNIIRKYYYEFERNKYSEKCPFEYTLNENDFLKEINDFILFNNNLEKSQKEIIKIRKSENENQNIKIIDNNQISPRIDRIFKNCFKFLFYYDKKMIETDETEKEKFTLNASNISGIQKRRHRKKNIADGKTEPSIFSESKILISYEDEMRAALNNEKIKYKIRISLLKFFGEQFLIEANNISNKTFENLDKSIIKSVDAQNTAMNSLMEKVKKDILEGRKKITYNIELDIFKIYHKLTLPFKEFILNAYNNLESKNKKISINDLNKIYLDLKNYEIQDNYVTVDSVKEIVFKKHLFEFKSNAFVKYLKELPYHYLNNLINKFIYKSSAGQNLVRIDRLFTILSLIDLSPPKLSQKREILENVSNKLKFHCFLSKEEFLNTILWFEKDDNNESNVISKIESTSSINNNLNYYKQNKYFSQRINLFELSPNKNNIIAEENYNENENDNDNGNENINMNNNHNISTNLNDINNDNDIIIPKDEKNEEINNETRIQMNNLFKNLDVRNPGKSPNRIKGRKTSKKMTKFSSSPIKIANEEYKLKDFLFDINKNYDNQINFIDFMNVVSLQFLKNKITKKKSNRGLNINLIKEIIKNGDLPIPTEKKRNSISRKYTEFIKEKEVKRNSLKRSTSQIINDQEEISDIKEKDLHKKIQQPYIIGDSEYFISRDGDLILINDKRYNINSFKENVCFEYTYLDELIEDIYQ